MAAAKKHQPNGRRSVSTGSETGVRRGIVRQAAFYGLLAIALFFYFWKAVRAQLYFNAQEPVFFLGSDFLRAHLDYPGGLLDYAAAFIAHLTYVPILGAAAFALLDTGLVLLFSAFLKRLNSHAPFFAAPLLLAPLLVLHNNYHFPPTIVLALAAATAAALGYTVIKSVSGRLGYTVAAATLLYYLAGNALFAYAVAVVIFEVTCSRRSLVPIAATVVLVFMLPYAAGARCTIMPNRAFLFPLVPEKSAGYSPWMLYAVFAVLLLLAPLGAALWKKPFFGSRKAFFVQALPLTVLLLAAALFTLRTEERQFWMFDYYARKGLWRELLKLCERPYLRNKQVMLQINRALLQTGALGDRMFFYHQPFDREGLFVFDEYDVTTTLIRSDLYFDLGHYNAAKQWAHEALSVRGETVWNLQRLALCYLIFEQKDAAALFFRKLEKTLFHREWARRYRPFWSGAADVRSDRELAALIANRVERDFITFPNYPEQDLPHLLQKNPRNRAAFEYLMADLLLSKKLKRFVDELRSRRLLGAPLPLHYQEALLFYFAQSQDESDDLKEFKPSRETVEAFRRFQSMVRQHAGNLKAAEPAFARDFGSTYWYYLLFHPITKNE